MRPPVRNPDELSAVRREMKVGVLSDTHGLLRPEVTTLLQGCDRIIHAGDVGKIEVLEALDQIAPTLAVRGNIDQGGWSDQLPVTRTVCWNGVRIHVLHDRNDLAVEVIPAGAQIIVSGHSHRACLEEKNRTIYLNPGSVGPRRFRLPVTLAWLHLPGDGTARVEPVTVLV